jgi:hypothetical protein
MINLKERSECICYIIAYMTTDTVINGVKVIDYRHGTLSDRSFFLLESVTQRYQVYLKNLDTYDQIQIY